MRLKLIACEIIFREVCYCVARSPHVVDVRFMSKGLHSIGEAKMVCALQEEIDGVPKGKYDAVLLGYGLCNNGIRGLSSKHTRLVVPRAHDCITLLLGSCRRYQRYFEDNPGTYFKSTGWCERDSELGNEDNVLTQLGINRAYEEYVARYGQENASYIMKTLGEWDWTKHYSRLAYVDMGIGEFPQYEAESVRMAEELGWTFERIEGDLRLIRMLVQGDWPENEFLVLDPGQHVKATYAGGIIEAGGL